MAEPKSKDKPVCTENDLEALVVHARINPGKSVVERIRYRTLDVAARRRFVTRMRALRNAHTMLWTDPGCTSTACREGDAPACAMCPSVVVRYNALAADTYTHLDDYRDAMMLDCVTTWPALVRAMARVAAPSVVASTLVSVATFCVLRGGPLIQLFNHASVVALGTSAFVGALAAFADHGLWAPLGHDRVLDQWARHVLRAHGIAHGIAQD